MVGRRERDLKESLRGTRNLRLLALLLIPLLVLAVAAAGAASAAMLTKTVSTQAPAKPSANKITADLQAKFASQPAGAQVQYWVVLADQADTTNNIPDSMWSEKGWYVYNTLTKKANDTQGPLLAQLNALQKQGQVQTVQGFWIINLIAVTGNLSSAQSMASYDSVARVEVPSTGTVFDDTPVAASVSNLSAPAQTVYNQTVQTNKDIQAKFGSLSSLSGLLSGLAVPLTVQHNISEVHAPQAWALGYDGTGVTVGSMDTGTRWTHEALNARYRGVVAPPDPGNIHDYNWFDGYSVYTVPTDNNGHGSHTMGTILGTSPNATYGNIGVAKNAMWMTVRICATSSCDSTPIMNGFQWTLAPTRVNGSDPNPALRPRISSNSWGNNSCSDTEFQTAVTNWVNAGIFPDFANGNAGPGAATVGVPAAYANSWGTGALDTSVSNWVIASFSSRGPSCYDGSIRPMALAPGVNICSSINTNDTSYSCAYSGTSMATPNIAGGVTVLLQKNPNLTIAQYMYAITSTAFFSSTWGTRPNNNYGWGLMQLDDALNSIAPVGTATPTATGTPPTNTPTVTNTSTPSPTATTCGVTSPIQEGFETALGVFSSVVATCAPGGCNWVHDTTEPHSGAADAFAPDGGDISDQYLQLTTAISIPAGTTSATLTFWHDYDMEATYDGGVLEVSTDGGTTWADVTAAGGTFNSGAYDGPISTGFNSPIAGRNAWTGAPGSLSQVSVNLNALIGQANLKIRFREATDSSVAHVGWYIDDVQLALGGACATGTPATATATATSGGGSPTATATCVPSLGSWAAGADLPSTLARSVGVYFPTNGNFYLMGGRSSDAAGSDQLNPLEYNPTANTWTAKSGVYNDSQVNNQACGLLTQGGTPLIFCVGGSAAGATTASAQVRMYNPVTDTLTGLATDNWPGNAGGDVLPGGFAVANNKLYILGGFEINVASTDEIWEFDPNAAAGSRWTQKVNTPVGIMYAPAASIGGIIYVGGASDYDGSTVIDTNTSFSFNPATNTIGTIATIPRATGETRAVVVDGDMWVLGGGRVAPNPSNEVDVYDPGTDSWSIGPAFTNLRRNPGADSDPATGRIWMAGGYDASGTTLIASLEIYTPGSGCSTPVPTATEGTVVPTDTVVATDTPVATDTSVATETATAGTPGATDTATAVAGSPTETPTVCTLSFEDVPSGSTFYVYIQCLACRGIINGYPCGGPLEPCNGANDPYFRPSNNVTRGQFAKIASNAAGFSDVPGGLQYTDVPIGSTYYDFIWRLSDRGFVTGYPCGGAGEPCDGANRPYFRPNANVTRGQLSKIDSNTAGFSDTATGQQYEDVAIGSTFYDFIYRLSTRNIIAGYACGGASEPCGSGNLPYFRPNANATRGQASKIVSNTFFPECSALRPAGQ